MAPAPAHPRPRPQPHPAKGYTLVELLMVVATVAMMLGIAVPRYGSAVARYRADAAAKRIAADVAYAQTQARSTSKSVTVTFSAATSGYQVSGVTSLSNVSGGYAVSLPDAPYYASIVSAGFGGGAVLTFDVYAPPPTAAPSSCSRGRPKKTVTVDAASGKVSVQ